MSDPLRIVVTAEQPAPGEPVKIDVAVRGRGRHLEASGVLEPHATDREIVAHVATAARHLIMGLADALARPPAADEPVVLARGLRVQVIEEPGRDYYKLAGREAVVRWAESWASVHLEIPTLTLFYAGGTGDRWRVIELADAPPTYKPLTAIVSADVLRARRGDRLVPVVLPPETP